MENEFEAPPPERRALINRERPSVPPHFYLPVRSCVLPGGGEGEGNGMVEMMGEIMIITVT